MQGVAHNSLENVVYFFVWHHLSFLLLCSLNRGSREEGGGCLVTVAVGPLWAVRQLLRREA